MLLALSLSAFGQSTPSWRYSAAGTPSDTARYWKTGQTFGSVSQTLFSLLHGANENVGGFVSSGVYDAPVYEDSTHIFAVRGSVKILAIIGTVDTAFTAVACSLKFFTEHVGGAITQISAGETFNNFAVGQTVYMPGAFANFLTKVAVGVPVANFAPTPYLVQGGTNSAPILIGWGNISNAVLTAGAVRWTAIWVPLEKGSYLVAL